MKIIDTDNRGLEETTLVLEGEKTVDVLPWELVENAIENSVEDEEMLEKFLKRLNKIKKDIEKYQEENY